MIGRTFFTLLSWSVFLLLPAVATDFSWDGTSGLYSNAGQWSPVGGPPVAGDVARFQTGSSFTVSGSGTAFQMIVDVSDVTFTGALSPTGSPTDAALIIGLASAGHATFDGSGATLTATSPVAVGASTTSSLTFSNGATGSAQGIAGASAGTLLGLNSTGNGTLTITGTDTTYTSTNSFTLGGAGTGVVHVEDHGHLETSGAALSAGLNIAGDSGAHGTLNISGDATVNNQFQTNLGLNGMGIINISSGSFTTSDNGPANPALSIGRFSTSQGDLNVSGTGQVTTVGEIIIGGDGIGRMTITDSGFVDSIIDTDSPAIVGFGASANGLATIDGPSAQWHVTDALVVGQQGTGDVQLKNGGTLFVEDTAASGDPYLTIGEADGAFGNVRVADEFSYLEAPDIPVMLGKDEDSNGFLDVTNQGEAFLQHTTVGGEGYGEVNLDGASTLTTGTLVIADKSTSEGFVDVREASTLDVLGQLIVGHESGGDAFNELAIADSAVTVLEFIVVGDQAGSDGSIYVESFENSGSASIGGTLTAMTIGNLGTGLLDLTGNVTVDVNGPTKLAVGPASEGEIFAGPDTTFTTIGPLTVGNEGSANFNLLGTLNSGTAYIAKSGGTSFASVNGGSWTISANSPEPDPENGSLFVGGDELIAGGTGQLAVTGALNVNNRVKIWNGSQAILNTGGIINAAAVEVLGDLSGTGTINAPTTDVSGLLAPKKGGNPHGKLTFDGDLTFDSTGRFQVEISGTTAETQYDVIDVTGDVMLDGFLDVFLINGFTLLPGQTFDIFNVTGSLTGLIENHAEGDVVGNFGGTDLFITYTGGDGNDIALFTNPSFSADFDNDGDVDGNDFLIWQRGGTTPPLDPAALTAWQAQYGTSLVAAANAIPEPTSLLLAFTFAIAWLQRYRFAVAGSTRHTPQC